MAEDGVLYGKSGAVATITLNRPEKYNTIRVEMALAIDEMLSAANRDNEVRVIVLEGAGDSFCAGFDFSNGLEHHQVFKEDGYDPGMDVFTSANSFIGRIPIYMGMWRGAGSDAVAAETSPAASASTERPHLTHVLFGRTALGPLEGDG